MRNRPVEMGILTVKHAQFRLGLFRLTAVLYHPESGTAYEVKTCSGTTEPNFRPVLHLYGRLLDSGLVKRVVFYHVTMGGSSRFSFSQWKEIHEAGFEAKTLRG